MLQLIKLPRSDDKVPICQCSPNLDDVLRFCESCILKDSELLGTILALYSQNCSENLKGFTVLGKFGETLRLFF